MAQSGRLLRCCNKCLRDASSEPQIVHVLVYVRSANGGMMQWWWVDRVVVVVEMRWRNVDVDVRVLIGIMYCVKDIERYKVLLEESGPRIVGYHYVCAPHVDAILGVRQVLELRDDHADVAEIPLPLSPEGQWTI
eukprot:2209524-Amphidinium_carterae.2